MSRGLGALESEVVMYLGLRARRPVLLTRVTVDLAHERRSVAQGGDLAESCDCPGPCQLVTRSLESSLRRAVLRLEDRGIVVAHLDHLQRKVLALASWPPAWKFGDDALEGERVRRLCPSCALGLTAKASRGEVG